VPQSPEAGESKQATWYSQGGFACRVVLKEFFILRLCGEFTYNEMVLDCAIEMRYLGRTIILQA
jgi:hypothetical protein